MDLQAEPSTLGPGLLGCSLLFKRALVGKTYSPRWKERDAVQRGCAVALRALWKGQYSEQTEG